MDNNNGSQNDPFLPPKDAQVPAYSARGIPNLNKPSSTVSSNTETLEAEKTSQTQEALFVDLSSDGPTPEIVKDIPKEEVVVKEVVEEHVVPEMDKFLAPETDPFPNLNVNPEYANPLPGQVISNNPEPNVIAQPVETKEEARPELPPREVNPYTHEDDGSNKFAGIFNNSKLDASPVEVPEFNTRPTLTPPPSSHKAVKKKGLPAGTLMVIALFVFGMIFVMFLPQISAFFENLFR